MKKSMSKGKTYRVEELVREDKKAHNFKAHRAEILVTLNIGKVPSPTGATFLSHQS